MSAIRDDVVIETTETVGTGDIELDGAQPGERAFDDVCADADTFCYQIDNFGPGGTDYEIGDGTYNAVANTITRNTVINSSNSNALVPFPPGTKHVKMIASAKRTVWKTGALTSTRVPYADANGELVDSAEITVVGGKLKVGSSAGGSTRGDFVEEDSATATVTACLVVGHNSTGTPAVGFGTGFQFLAESTTTANQNQASIESVWSVATHGTRSAQLVFYAYYTSTANECLRLGGTLGGATVGFFGVTPVAKQGATIDLGTALSNLGLRTAGTAYPITTSGAIAFSGAVTLTGGVTINTVDLTITDINIALGTAIGTKIGMSALQKLAFYNLTPIVQPATTGETSGVTAGTGTAVRQDSTFTGNVGSTAYRISDIVKHLKNLGLIAS